MLTLFIGVGLKLPHILTLIVLEHEGLVQTIFQRYHLLVCDYCRLLYRSLKVMGGKRVRIFEAMLNIF